MTAAILSRYDIADIRIGKRNRRDMGDIGALASNIADVGLLHPIVIRPDGKLIAGERRLRAAKHLGWKYIPVHVIDLDQVVLGEYAENTFRKAFTPSEMVAIADAIEAEERAKAKHRQGQRIDKHPEKFSGSSRGRALDKIATVAGTSRPTLTKARAVVHAAAAEPKRFGKLVEYMDETGRVDRAFKQLQIAHYQEEHAERIKSGCTADDLVALAASGKRFPVIYADPAWEWETWGGPSGKVRSAPDNHYGTSRIEEIMKLPVAPLAADDCALLLWCTWPHISIGTHIEIMRAWGFKPSTAAFVWVKQISETNDKPATGMGYWTRSNTEVCFIATKGSPLRLATDVHQVVSAPVMKHSEKPEEVRRRIERLLAGPYLELYGRELVPRWTVWGNEIPRDCFGSAEAEEAE